MIAERFEVGEQVCATAVIRRVDGLAGMYPGGPVGTVINSWVNSGRKTQIIDVQVGSEPPMCTLVVSERLPLQKVHAKEAAGV